VNLRRLGGPLLAVLVGLSVYALWPKEELSPEDQIRALVATLVHRAEARDVSGLLEPVAENFSGGGLGKQELKQLVVSQLFRAQQVVVLNPLLEVTVSSPTEGHFEGQFLLGRDGAAPEGSRYEIEADLRKTDDGWQIVSASWRRP
jgi:hypothetical protein